MLTQSMHCIWFSFLIDSANVTTRGTVSVDSHKDLGLVLCNMYTVWVALDRCSLEQGAYVAHVPTLLVGSLMRPK